MKPAYIPTYDTENPACLSGVKRIVEIHEAMEVPATFFVVARLLEEQGDEYVALLKDHPLFEIACHTYSHMPLVDTPRYGAAGPVDRYPQELVTSKTMLEDAFQCEIRGFRPPVSSPDGLKGADEALKVLHEAGYGYVSSAAWGPDFSLPAPLRKPYTYEDHGFPDLWEVPPCGWHENLLKGNNKIGPVLLCLFPAPIPEAIPPGYIETAEEEFQYNCKPFIDRAIAGDFPHVTPIWHPWSLHAFDPTLKMIEITFAYAREVGLETSNMGEYWDRISS